MQFHLLQSFLCLVAVPNDNNDNTVVAPASMTTSSGGTVAAAAVAAFVEAARYCLIVGDQG